MIPKQPDLTVAERRILRAMIEGGGSMATRGDAAHLAQLEARGYIRRSGISRPPSGPDLITHEITEKGRRAAQA